MSTISIHQFISVFKSGGYCKLHYHVPIEEFLQKIATNYQGHVS